MFVSLKGCTSWQLGQGKATQWQGAIHLLAALPSQRLAVSAVAMNSAIAAGCLELNMLRRSGNLRRIKPFR